MIDYAGQAGLSFGRPASFILVFALQGIFASGDSFFHPYDMSGAHYMHVVIAAHHSGRQSQIELDLGAHGDIGGGIEVDAGSADIAGNAVCAGNPDRQLQGESFS